MDPSNFVGIKRRRSIESSLTWVDKYEPKLVNEIGISKVKIKQVQNAIERSAIVRGKIKLLILTGPTGCGKSTLIKLLCRQYGFEITEWITPERNWSSQFGHMQSFRQFMDKATGFKTLDSADRETKGKVILMDDIPDLFTDNVKQEYLSIIQSCLDSSKKFLIVMIASDAYTNNQESNFSRKENYARIIAPDLLKKDDRVEYIEFNSLSRLSMSKILSTIKNREGMPIPDDYLNNLIDICNGDIRSAINELQFKSNTEKKIPKLSQSSPFTRNNNLVCFDRHTSNLTLFHAVGKVLYAKRNHDNTLESKPDDIINKLPVDNDYFNDYIHQNCIGFFQNIEDCSNALEDLGFADSLRSEFDWLDKSSSYYRSYISIYGIMKHRHGATKKTLKMTGTEFSKLKFKSKKESYQAYEKMWLESVALRNSYYAEEQERSVNKNVDEFKKSVTEQEGSIQDNDDAMFDELFGDGSELVELDFY